MKNTLSRMHVTLVMLIIALSYVVPTHAGSNDVFYISPDGNDNNDGRSAGTPLKTFSKAVKKLSQGATLYVMPGQYNASAYNAVIDLTSENSGSHDGYVSIKAYDANNPPVLYAYGKGVWNAINITASYILIEGLEVKGGNDLIGWDDAYGNARSFINGEGKWNDYAVTNTNGISIGGTSASVEARPHHVIIRNCKVHDFPGSGISAAQADWITIDRNEVYNNAWFTFYGCSGISLLTPYDSDSNSTDYKMVVTNNMVYNNKTTIPWARHKDNLEGDYSDGNGIIVDINNRAGDAGKAKGEGAYNGHTLVANNVSYYNGGSGIHVFKANNVDVVNNTTCYNQQMYVSGYSELDCNQGANCRFYNNVLYADPEKHVVSSNYGALDCAFMNNVYYNGSVDDKWGTDNKNIQADPMFVRLGGYPLDSFDFHLSEGSPASGAGVWMAFVPEKDIEGCSRQHEKIDCGAYVFSSSADISVKDISFYNTKRDTRRFNISGQSVFSDYKGVVIFNGKKYMVR